MNNLKNNSYSLSLMLIVFLSSSCGLSRQEKTIAIIEKMNILELQQTNFRSKLYALKSMKTKKDSLNIVDIEKQLSEEKIVERICLAFDDMLSNAEINDIYEFIQTSVFDKCFNSIEMYKAIENRFSDIDTKILLINNKFQKQLSENKFKPIPVDRENGFYLTSNYSFSMKGKDVKLNHKPALSKKDILKIEKSYNKSKFEINIVWTKSGANKFYLFTKENIGKTIAIVVDKKIISMPKIVSGIKGEKISISGDFSEIEINRIIQKLKNK